MRAETIKTSDVFTHRAIGAIPAVRTRGPGVTRSKQLGWE
jgi:hypothetical protein